MITEVPIRALVEYAIGGGWGSETPTSGSMAVRILRGTDFANAKAGDFSKVPRRFEPKEKATRRLLQPGDIVLEISGGSKASNQTTGRTLLITERLLSQLGTAIIPASFCRLIRLRSDHVVPKYAYYALQEMYQSGRAGSYEHHSTGISNFQFEYFLDEERVALPPLPEQYAIAELLGALDDKIELNHRMNATLEAMTRALFQSWFVDFDPVRAKLDGRLPVGLDPATATLFPDSFHGSEVGPIPMGWRVGKVSEVADFGRSSINPGDFPSETFDHYSLPAFDEGRKPKEELGYAIKSNKLIVTPRSVLLSKLNPHIPRVWLPNLHATRRSVCSTEFIVASGRSAYSREFLYSLFTSAAFASTYGSLVTGTTGSHQRIRAESVQEMSVALPPLPLVEAFTKIANPLLELANQNIEQSRSVATLRDSLLPRLLSGELSMLGAQEVTRA